jgi:tetratricopeptide (TPR) repeat protein
MGPIQNRTGVALALVACLTGIAAAATLGSSPALAVDTVTSKDAPDLSSVRAKIKAKDYQAALAELKVLADTHQHADVYSLMGFSLRQTGDYPTALTFYKKALDFDADHKGAREYLGELYVEIGNLVKAREQRSNEAVPAALRGARGPRASACFGDAQNKLTLALQALPQQCSPRLRRGNSIWRISLCA